MNVGMLWYDNDPKHSLTVKISQALAYYKEKYSVEANCVYVHPSTLGIKDTSLVGVEIKTSRSVLPNHLWIGRNDDVS